MQYFFSSYGGVPFSRPSLIWQDDGFARTLFETFGRPDTAALCRELANLTACLKTENFGLFNRLTSDLHSQCQFQPSNPAEQKSLYLYLLNTPFIIDDETQSFSLMQRAVSSKAPKDVLIPLFRDGLDSRVRYTIEEELLTSGKDQEFRKKPRTPALHQENFSDWESYELQGSSSASNSLAHFAVTELNLTALECMVKLGADINSFNSEGFTPLSLAIDHVNILSPSSEKVAQYLISVSDPGTEYPLERHPVTISFLKGDWHFAQSLCRPGISPPSDQKETSFETFSNPGSQIVSFSNLVLKTAQLIDQISKMKSVAPYMQKGAEIVREGLDLFAKNKNFYHLYLYLQSFYDLTDRNPSSNGHCFAKLAIACYNHYSLRDISKLLWAYESTHDKLFAKNDYPLDYDRQDAEMLLLLAHPELEKYFDEKIGSMLTRAVTSPYRYIDFGQPTIEMSKGGWLTIQNWQRLGQLTHGFLRWKYDSMRPPYPESSGHCLLEDFGFYRVREAAPQQAALHKILWICPETLNLSYTDPLRPDKSLAIRPNSTVILNHAFIAISDSRLGSLVIRNSSTVYGRTVLKHCAYYDPPAPIGSDLKGKLFLDASPQFIEHNFAPILAREINAVPASPFPPQNPPLSWRHRPLNFTKHIAHLLAQLDSTLSAFQQWKFNTDPRTAFLNQVDPGKADLAGAYNSPGFQKFVAGIDAWFTANPADKTPCLAFVRPFAPPWANYTYQTSELPGEPGSSTSRFKIDEYSMEVLRDLAQGIVDEDDLKLSGLLDFFQMGINNAAELMLIDSK